MPAPRSTCEPCHRRRVRCDLPEKPDGCSNCSKRDINCPGIRTVAPRKPRRGAVIDQVERDFGAGQIDVLNGEVSSTAGSSNHSTYSTPMPSTDQVWSALIPVPSPTSTETGLATLELSSELAISMMSTFNVSHGNIFRQIQPQLYVKTFAAACRRFDAVEPNQEIMMRVMIALGARSTYHPAIIEGGDLNFPFTLGLCREGPCRALARAAVTRFEALGIRSHATVETVQVATSVYFISRTVLTPEEARPIANVAVDLFRQLIANATYDITPTSTLFHTGLIVIWADARSAAETGNRPTMTTDDLDDIPALRDWLNQSPDDEEPMGSDAARFMLYASMIRLLRIFGADFRRPMRRYLGNSLQSLPGLWDLLTKISTRSTTLIETIFRDLPRVRVDENATDAAIQALTNLFLIHTTCVYVAISIYDILEGAMNKTGGAEWFMPCIEALAKAQEGMKKVARLIELVQTLGEGPMVWIHFVRMFHSLEHCPGWTRLLTPPASGPPIFTEKEYQLLTDGIQQTGFGAGWGAERWLEVLKIRGIYVEPNIEPNAMSIDSVPQEQSITAV